MSSLIANKIKRNQCFLSIKLFIGSVKYPFLENTLKKKTTEYFLKFLFLFESTILTVNNGKEFHQMAASAVHAVVYTIGPICKHIINCVQLYFTNGFTNIVLQRVNCLWLVSVTLISDGTPQIIVQRCQIAASKWPNDMSSAADNAIFKNRTQNIECSFVCMALEPSY